MPIITAAYHRNYNVVKLLLLNGAEIKPEDDYVKTLFFDAVESGDVGLVELLLNKDVEIDQVGSSRGLGHPYGKIATALFRGKRGFDSHTCC